MQGDIQDAVPKAGKLYNRVNHKRKNKKAKYILDQRYMVQATLCRGLSIPAGA